MAIITPPYELPDLRPMRALVTRMRLVGGAVITDNGTLQSEDYQPGVSGWAIFGDGSAEFNNLDARGTLQSDNYVAGISGWIINQDGTAEFYELTARGDLESDNFVAGTSGWQILADGNAEFNDVTIRGRVIIGGGFIDSTLGISLPEAGNALAFSPGTDLDPVQIAWADSGGVPREWIYGQDSVLNGHQLVVHAEDTLALTGGAGQLILNADGASFGTTQPVRIGGNNLLDDLTPYTPTDSNITVGNGTRQAAYWKLGRLCFIEWYLLLGTTSTIGTAAAIGLPFAGKNLSAAGYQALAAVFEEGGVGSQPGIGRIADNASLAVLVHHEGTSGGALTATAPFTWGSTDVIAVTGFYWTDA